MVASLVFFSSPLFSLHAGLHVWLRRGRARMRNRGKPIRSGVSDGYHDIRPNEAASFLTTWLTSSPVQGVLVGVDMSSGRRSCISKQSRVSRPEEELGGCVAVAESFLAPRQDELNLRRARWRRLGCMEGWGNCRRWKTSSVTPALLRPHFTAPCIGCRGALVRPRGARDVDYDLATRNGDAVEESPLCSVVRCSTGRRQLRCRGLPASCWDGRDPAIGSCVLVPPIKTDSN